MKKLASGLLIFTFAATSLVASSSKAVVYEVNRSFTEGLSTVALTGTVEVSLGNYVIQNQGPSPFTAVDLTLTVNSTPYNLTNALTDLILGTGQFFIDATPTTLTFSTANADGANPADLLFADPFNNYYAIGSNGDPHFEVASVVGAFVVADVSFPDVFGIAIPEPSSIMLVGIAMLGLSLRRRRLAFD